jgi:hypothetical protein
MTDAHDAIRRLHTRLVDAREGYAEGIELADSPDMVVLFRELHDLHDTHARALEAAMTTAGRPLDGGGSLMAEVHKAVLTVRSAVTGLAENAIPSIRDGEKRILSSYDDTIAALPADDPLSALVEAQRETLAHRVALLDYRGADA